MITTEDFMGALAERKKVVYDYLYSTRFSSRFSPDHIRDAVYSYMHSGGKSLRPAVLLFACGAVGGDDAKAIPAAAAIEIFHTWTLVHDDVIDRDDKRRGGPTVHTEFSARARDELGYDAAESEHYGLSLAILAGDMQQGWAISILAGLAEESGVDPAVALYLIHDAEMRVLSLLIDGEIRDVQFAKRAIPSMTEDEIIDMLSKKTGVLYEFAGKAGSMIGLNTCDDQHPYVHAVSSFAADCGTAFQLQDDILGIIGDEASLGKPVGSDIREGKRTTIVLHAYRNANEAQRARLLAVLGNPSATAADVAEVTALLRDLNGVQYTANLARRHIERARQHLSEIPPSKYRDYLAFWADYMVGRSF
ncbi:polyprenyl synthetase family protein [Candidatus Poribacteria bacterium]|nr:polyprenyl synthetase family protein [Candidatus Poribacteria bacterium]